MLNQQLKPFDEARVRRQVEVLRLGKLDALKAQAIGALLCLADEERRDVRITLDALYKIVSFEDENETRDWWIAFMQTPILLDFDAPDGTRTTVVFPLIDEWSEEPDGQIVRFTVSKDAFKILSDESLFRLRRPYL
jgi:hypothetical protein